MRATFDGTDLALPFDHVRLGEDMDWGLLGAVRKDAKPKPRPSGYTVREPTRVLVHAQLPNCGPIDIPSDGAEVVARLGVVGADQDLTITWRLKQEADVGLPDAAAVWRCR